MTLHFCHLVSQGGEDEEQHGHLVKADAGICSQQHEQGGHDDGLYWVLCQAHQHSHSPHHRRGAQSL